MSKMFRRLFGYSIFILVSIVSVNAKENEKVILFFGNSLTAGMGLEQSQAFPNLVQQKITEEGMDYLVINAGLSGETSAGGLNRIDWVLNQHVDIFILELGANDGLRGVPLEATKQNLQGIIDKVRHKYPEVQIVLAGMMVPPNMGEAYGKGFSKIFPDLSRENEIALIPFLLEEVAGNPDLNLPDGIHPNIEGQQIVAENVWKVLKELL